MQTLFRFLLILLILVPALAGAQTKKPPITPRWAFGHLVWEDSINTQQAATMLVEGYLKRNIPVSGVIIDSPWSTAYSNFNWNLERYPDPTGMIADFSRKNVKIVLWLTGCVNLTAKDMPLQKHERYDWVREKGYAINNGQPSEWWKGKGLHIDFTNPEAKAWWYTQLDKVFVDGVWGWKTDQGEIFFGDTVTTSIGRMTNEQFRPYYYDAMFEYATERNTKGGLIIGRPFSHQGGVEADITELNMGWCGDFTGDWAGLKHQISNIYQSAELGYGALACEVGGFWKQRSSKEEFIRYCQFGAMTACMINGGENGAFSNHLPWWHDAQTEKIYRDYCVLHQLLIPYLFSTVVDCHLNGGSIIPWFSAQEESHLLGPFLFTKAITSPIDTIRFRLPEGSDWYDFKTGKKMQGGTKFEIPAQQYPLEEYPIFVRSGAVIPMDMSAALTDSMGIHRPDGQTILIYPGGPISYLYHKPLGEGTEYEDVTFSYDEAAGKLSVQAKTKDKWTFVIMDQNEPGNVKKADAWRYEKAERTLTLEKDGRAFTINIH